MSLYYADTSAVIKLLAEQSHSKAFAAFYDSHADLDGLVSYDTRLTTAASDAGLVTLSPQD